MYYGFSEEFRNKIIKYLLIYTENLESQRKTPKRDIAHKYPDTVAFYKENICPLIREKESTNSVEDVLPNEEKLLMTYSYTKMMSFFCHLRNSICHGHLRIKGDYLQINDIHKGKYTSIGQLKVARVIELLSILIREYETNNV